ncbi:DUF6782 family putative metallopeptidase [Kordiimonas laminariae]|uniref:DUF6782 family putative metallopeptidase n=1 Tax=Kordiimonas laminariae TaxID=2917717 RepID=UPI001FF4D685|nr:DUF6782 family putative metallopeptidase [Kordiimonas laminariae]MCK0070060.1 hypothetical protein [Kordiimonas laminariae]
MGAALTFRFPALGIYINGLKPYGFPHDEIMQVMGGDMLRAENLSYSVHGKSRLKHYMQYVLMPGTEKTKWLFGLVRKDAFFSRIVDELEASGYDIKHRFYGRSGAYIPHTIKLKKEGDPTEALNTLKAAGKLKARFTFSARYGGVQQAHYFLHELMHFWQDQRSLYLNSMQVEGKIPIMLDAESRVRVTCFLEAMAEVEAIRASWRLKEAGYDAAWLGALSSLDWGKLARAYAADIDSMPEPEAARRAFDCWYQGPHRVYYEKRGLMAYERLLQSLPTQDVAEIKSYLRNAQVDDLLDMLPEEDRPAYLTLGGAKSLKDGLYNTVYDKNTAGKAKAYDVSV